MAMLNNQKSNLYLLGYFTLQTLNYTSQLFRFWGRMEHISIT